MKNSLRVNVLGALLVTLLATGASTDSPVADAAERGDLETVRSLLRQGADVNAPQGDGMSALHWAAMKGDAEMAAVILYAGANTEATTRLGGFTPLHLASKDGHAEVVQRLLEQGADPEAKTATGVEPIHLAAASGRAEAVSELILAGASVDAREVANEQTPLMWASAKNRLEAMKTLIDAGADVSTTARVIDYGEIGRLDGPDRQRRRTLVDAARDADAALAAATSGGDEPPAAQAAPQAPAPAAQADPAQDRRAAAQQALRRAQANRQLADSTVTPPQPDPDQAAGANALQQRVPGGAAQGAPAQRGGGGGGGGGGAAGGGDETPLGYNDLVGKEGGLTALHYAARDGHAEAAALLLDAGADVNQVTAGDGTSPILMATINGNYDLAMTFLAVGADPNLESEDGVVPLFAVFNNRWAPKALFPQPTAFQQQETGYLELAKALLEGGADVNHPTKRHIWYTSFNFDLLGVDFAGATPFWRAAYATDVPAMRLLIAHGADPNIPTAKGASRRFGRGGQQREDASGLPEVPAGGPAVYPIHAASGAGYGTSRAGNSHRHAPDGWLPTVKYLVEELGADVNARDMDGYSPVHHAAARGDNELIMYLVSMGANVTDVSRRGQTTVDMANGPQQRVQPFPETIALLEGLGAKNNNNCQSC